MITKQQFIIKLDSYINAKVASGKVPCHFSLNDVTGITGEVLPGVWLYEIVVKNKRYSNVRKSGHSNRGNVYTID